MVNDAFDAERVTAASFLFEVHELEIGRFKEITGLEVTVETEELFEGGQNGFVHKLPSRMTWPNIVLRRGITQSDTLIEWLNASSGQSFSASGNKLERRTAAITLIGAGGARLRAWEFDGAFAVRWSGPNFDAGSSDMAVEELEIAHHGFRVKQL